ncbi:MAG: hypothetical protein GY749_07145, partial [Desulfobacteraceae bacterium]|nr:hypothetical protein [Desulfobacteraceae bacterium]
ALLTLEISVNSSVLFSGNRIFAFADSKNTVDETDENNNIKHNMADCEFVPPTAGGFNPVPEWEWTGSKDIPTSNQVMCTPVVANLSDDNGDNMVDENDIPDIIFNSFIGLEARANGIIRAVSGDGSKEIFSVTEYKTYPLFTPAVGDIDRDGLPEVIALSEPVGNCPWGRNSCSFNVLAFENDGSYKWTSDEIIIPESGYTASSITLSDIDEDGVPEIIVGNAVFDNKGKKKWVGTGGFGLGASCVANLDLEGYPEIIAGNTAYRANGEKYWSNASVGDGFTGIGNFDDDPNPEIVVVAEAEVYLLEHTGDIIWKVDLPGCSGICFGGSPAIADFDNDGKPEIGVSGRDKYTMFESDGTVVWSADINEDFIAITSSSVFDFEGDGSAEVVYSDVEKLIILNGTDGKSHFDSDPVAVGGGTWSDMPIIADVDNDNNAEIIVVSSNWFGGPNNGIQVFGDAKDRWVNTRKIWNQYSYHITNVNDDGTIPRVEANNWETFNNYRQNQMLNPFGCIDLTGSRVRADKSGYPDSVKITARFGNGGALHIAPGAAMS